MEVNVVQSIIYYNVVCRYTNLIHKIDGLATVVTQQYNSQMNEEARLCFAVARQIGLRHSTGLETDITSSIYTGSFCCPFNVEKATELFIHHILSFRRPYTAVPGQKTCHFARAYGSHP